MSHGLPGRAGRREPASSVAPVASGYERSLRPWLAAPSATGQRVFIPKRVLQRRARGGGLELRGLARAEERGDGGGEDVLVRVVLAREVDRAVQLEDEVLARPGRQQVDADEVDPDGGGRLDREVAGARRCYRRPPRAA